MNKLILLALLCVALSACSASDKTFIVPRTSEEGKAVLRQFREDMQRRGIEGADWTLPDGAKGKLHFNDQAKWVLQTSTGDVEVEMHSPTQSLETLTVRRAN